MPAHSYKRVPRLSRTAMAGLLAIGLLMPWQLGPRQSPQPVIGFVETCWAQETQPVAAAGAAAATSATPTQPAGQPSPGGQPASPPPAGAAALPVSPPTGPPGERLVSNVFFETDIKQTLSDVATQTATTIMADESVTGFVTLELQNVPLDRALRLILMPGGFVYEQVEEGVYIVTSPKPDASGFRQIARTEVVELNYVDSEELAALLPGLFTAFVKFDKLGNRVVVTAPPSLLKETIGVIKSIDTPRLQVLIEALVMETSRRALDEFRVSLQGQHLGLETATGTMTYVGQAEKLLHELVWMVGREKAVIRANPRVVAQEGQEATVKVGVEQYFEIVSGRVGWEFVQLQAIEAAVSLSITPHVAREDRMVTCTIKPEVGDVTGTSSTELPIITKRSAETTVRISDGQVIAIGGLLQELKHQRKRKIPLLGDLPLVGLLFRSQSTESDTREVIIFIVPHILDDAGGFTGPLLFDRLLEGQPSQSLEGASPPQEDTRSEREKRRDQIRQRVSKRTASEQPSPKSP